MISKGKFIVIEGIDGSGITTHANLLKDWFKKNKIDSTLSSEPTDSPIGLLIRAILKEHWKITKRPDILGLLYAADRLYHVSHDAYGQKPNERKGLKDALNEGRMVIFNRYILSSIAYQGFSQDKITSNEKWIRTINKLGRQDGIPNPDLTIFLDVAPEIATDRIKKERERYELFEHDNYLTKVYKNYKQAIKKREFNAIVVHGTIKKGNNLQFPRPIEEVQNDIRRHVVEMLQKSNNPNYKKLKSNWM